MQTTHLWPEETVEANGSTTVSITIERPTQERTRLWYRVPTEYSNHLTHTCDPFVVATLLLAMNQSTRLLIHGEVSPSLLQNLTEFQAAWACWCPQKYRQIEMTAEVEREFSRTIATDKAISTFSGGVDSCFTVFRHKTGRCGRLKRNLHAGVMVHGFDIPLEEQDVFERAAGKSKAMLASIGMELIPIATNFRHLGQDWEHVFGTGVASTLMLLQGGYQVGLIPSSDCYNAMEIPYGSNPITDYLLSNQNFQIVHDGASFTRIEKTWEISNWSEVLQNLRVCWEGSHKDRNCGRCEKCIRTILGFRVLGMDLPPCFEQDVTDEQILGIQGLRKYQIIIQLEPILEAAKGANISDPWMRALEQCIRNNYEMLVPKPPRTTLKQRLRSRIRQVRSLLSRT